LNGAWEVPLLAVVCLLAGAAPGALLVRLGGRRCGGFWTGLAAIAVPLLVGLTVDSRTAFVGVWDVLCAGLLLSAGFLLVTSPHLALGRREIAVAVASAAFGLVLLEGLAR